MASKLSRSNKRMLHEKVRTAKGRKTSSTRWLQRQLNDPYVLKAREEGYRSRAAYKLIEIDDKLGFLEPGKVVVDLGAAPGGWTQVAVQRTKSEKGQGKVLGIDLLEIPPVPGATLIQKDFMDEDAEVTLMEHLGEKPDIVLSDMAASSCGHAPTDHLRIIGLCEVALDFAIAHLKPEGTFLAKVLQGGTERELLQLMQSRFTKVKHIKPPSSRSDSAEMYVVATGFKPV